MTDHRDTSILVVEDEEDLADLYTRWLNEKYAVETAYTGDEALQELDGDTDVVLLDRRMPGLSGDEVLEEVADRNIDCQVAMVTAVEPDFDIVEMGCNDYLTKPITQGELQSTVKSLLNRRQYDAKREELFSLLNKSSALKQQKSEEELAQSAEYQQLVEQILTVKSEVDELVQELSESDPEALFRQLDSKPRGRADD